jgi:hypothetical protein
MSTDRSGHLIGCPGPETVDSWIYGISALMAVRKIPLVVRCEANWQSEIILAIVRIMAVKNKIVCSQNNGRK